MRLIPTGNSPNKLGNSVEIDDGGIIHDPCRHEGEEGGDESQQSLRPWGGEVWKGVRGSEIFSRVDSIRPGSSDEEPCTINKMKFCVVE